ncbi:single-stranded DNA-binding protein [Streptomyces sp. NPDC055060]
MAPSVIHVSGTITGDVEVRLTRNDIAVCRFRLTQTPNQWDATTHKWCDETPIPYICTAWRDLARNATTALADGTNVLATGHITEIRNNSIYLTIDDLGISLHRRPAHADTNPPTTLAAHPTTTPPTPQPTTSSRPAAGRPQTPPPWWTQKQTSSQT